MLVTEYPYGGNETLIKTYSNKGKYLVQNETGIKYDCAIDIYPGRYTYTETDEDIAVEETKVDAEIDALEK